MQRNTKQTALVARSILNYPENQRIYGYPLLKNSGMRSGVVYPILHRMVAAGWLTDGWEKQPHGRPARRYYEVTDLGQDKMAKLIDLVIPDM